MVASLTYVGGEHIELPLNTKNPWRIWRNARLLEKLIRKHKVDIVHARSRAPGMERMDRRPKRTQDAVRHDVSRGIRPVARI